MWRTSVRDVLSAVSVEPGHELAVDLTGGFEFFGAPGEGLLGVEESLLELADAGGNVRVCGAADLGGEHSCCLGLRVGPAKPGQVSGGISHGGPVLRRARCQGTGWGRPGGP